MPSQLLTFLQLNEQPFGYQDLQVLERIAALNLSSAEIQVCRHRIMVSEDGTSQMYFQVRLQDQEETLNLIKHYSDFENLHETMQATLFVEEKVPGLPARDHRGTKKPAHQMQQELQLWLGQVRSDC